MVSVHGVDIELIRPKAADCGFVSEYVEYIRELVDFDPKKQTTEQVLESERKPMECVVGCMTACIEGLGKGEAENLLVELGYNHELVRRCAVLCGAERLLAPVFGLNSNPDDFDDHPIT